jgi:hypothetical protein
MKIQISAPFLIGFIRVSRGYFSYLYFDEKVKPWIARTDAFDNE